MEWHINVAKVQPGDGIYKDFDTYVHHFKAVCSAFGQACAIYKELREHYPAPKYSVTMYEVEKTFTKIEEDEMEA